MDKRKIKEDCYKEMLEDSLNSVDSVINQLRKLDERKEMFASHIIQKAQYRTYFDLELALASLCILLRKMAENRFIIMDSDIRRDVNSIIHSNKFEYVNKQCIYVYSQKGREEVSLEQLLMYARAILQQ